MKLIDFLRKLGIFRFGTSSGIYTKTTDRPTEFQMDNIFDARKELTTKKIFKEKKEKIKSTDSKEKIEKIKFILNWILGIFFVAIGLFSFNSSFMTGFSGILIGVLICPKTANFLISKIKFLADKKWRIGLIIVSFLIFLFSLGNSTKNYSINIKTGQDDPQIVMEFQKDLIELINNYKEAQIKTVVISQIKFGGAKLEEAQKYTKETEKKWEEVENLAKKMEKYIEYQKKKERETTSWLNFLKAKKVLAEDKDNDAEKYKVDVDMESKPGEFTGMENNNTKEVELQDKEKNLIQTKWDMVEITRASLPDKSLLKAVMIEFGTTARKSKELIEQYHGEMAKVWNDEEKYNHSRENFFKVMSTASSVGLTIGGGVVFMGDLVAATAGSTVLSGLKLATETTVLAFAKTDAILEVMETGIIVATGDEKNAAAITQIRESTAKINAVVAVKDLIKSPTLADGGNLSTIYNLGEAVANTAENVFLFNEEDNKMKVKIGGKFTPMSSDGIVNEYFPPNFEYEYSNWGDNYQKQKLNQSTQEQKKTNDYQGNSACWRGDSMDNETYQRILKFQDRHNAAIAECKKELEISGNFDLGHPRWLEVMQCACNKDPEAAVARTYCCSDATMEEIRQGLMNDLKSLQNGNKK